MKYLLGLCAFGLPVLLSADVLETENYRIRVETRCEEGNVSCNHAHFEGLSKRSGYRLALVGESLHQPCKDGVTPCRFLGYYFEKDDFNYYVYEAGTFIVKQKDNLLIEETGEWFWAE
ncbi:hypothetical protein [Marinomonas algicola]|uniref:hypothetical protein n=1 Tax=Marinomonas algicola TaxID=2773454 RepID=UPI00174EA054|nr:hypothetical protein [Marinomonas algicola]